MKSRKIGGKVFDVFNYALLALIAFVTLYPFLYVIFASLSDPVQLMGNSAPLWKPLGFSLGAYKKVFSNSSIYIGYANTIFYVVVGTTVNIIMTCIAAYVLSRKQFMLRRFFTLMPGAISTFNLMIMITGFEGIPKSLEESARIDGAGDWTILFRIIMPLAKPTIMVILLYYAVGHWNAWFNAMIYIRDASKRPLQLFLRDILTRSQMGAMTGQTDIEDVGQTIKYATILVSTAPILCIYPFIQKYFVQGVMIGAVKE